MASWRRTYLSLDMVKDPAWVILDSRHGIRSTSGKPGMAIFNDRAYPACSIHGAMNKVHPSIEMWRCMADDWTCNIGMKVDDGY